MNARSIDTKTVVTVVALSALMVVPVFGKADANNIVKPGPGPWSVKAPGTGGGQPARVVAVRPKANVYFHVKSIDPYSTPTGPGPWSVKAPGVSARPVVPVVKSGVLFHVRGNDDAYVAPTTGPGPWSVKASGTDGGFTVDPTGIAKAVVAPAIPTVGPGPWSVKAPGIH